MYGKHLIWVNFDDGLYITENMNSYRSLVGNRKYNINKINRLNYS